jgi:hypothetical protein
MPMLANVLLRTQGKNQLLVAATDLKMSVPGGENASIREFPAFVAEPPGSRIRLGSACPRAMGI